MLLITSVFCMLLAATTAATVQLPPLTGPYSVGTTSLELIDHSRADPLAPTPGQPRALMVSITYPARPPPPGHDDLPFSPYCTAAEAAVFSAIADAAIFTPLASLTSYCTAGPSDANQTELLTQTYLDAPPLRTPSSPQPFPVILFSPGFGGSRLMQAATVADLSSRGWVVVNVDHTYDAAAVVFPDGAVRLEKPGLLTALFADLPNMGAYLADIRADDLRFVLGALRNAKEGIAGSLFGKSQNRTDEPLALDKVGLLGGSLGGATAARLLLDGGPYACGANLDGGVYGAVLNTSEPRPFLTLATPGHNASSDSTFAAFFEQLKRGGSFSRDVAVNGTVHQSFLDVPLLRDLLPPVRKALETSEGGPGVDAWGTIGGQRLVEIQNRLADSFFGYCLKGKPSSLLDDAVRRFPELSVVD